MNRPLPLVALLVGGAWAQAPMVPAASAEGFPPVSGGGAPVAAPAIAPMGFGSPTPLLRPSMRQSVSMSMASDGSRSVSQSMYVNEMSWRLSDPLTLHLDLGVASPLWARGPGTGQLRDQTAELYPRLGLEWRPSESSVLMLSVARTPAWSSWTDPWPSADRVFPAP